MQYTVLDDIKVVTVVGSHVTQDQMKDSREKMRLHKVKKVRFHKVIFFEPLLPWIGARIASGFLLANRFKKKESNPKMAYKDHDAHAIVASLKKRAKDPERWRDEALKIVQGRKSALREELIETGLAEKIGVMLKPVDGVVLSDARFPARAIFARSSKNQWSTLSPGFYLKEDDFVEVLTADHEDRDRVLVRRVIAPYETGHIVKDTLIFLNRFLAPLTLHKVDAFDAKRKREAEEAKTDRKAVVRARINDIAVTQNDLNTADPGMWLNDQLINSYLHLLVHNSLKLKGVSVYAFQTFFLQVLVRDSYIGVEKWTKRVFISLASKIEI